MNNSKEKVYTVQFDLVIPMDDSHQYSTRTLDEDRLFRMVRDQIKSAFTTEVCSTRNWKLGRKCVNPLTKELDAKGELV